MGFGLGGLEDLAQALHDKPEIQHKIKSIFIGGSIRNGVPIAMLTLLKTFRIFGLLNQMRLTTAFLR
jgi:hypothetical protein